MLSWLFSAVGLAALKGEFAAIRRRTRRRVVALLLAALFWLLALGFALAALTVWLTGQLGGLAACAIVAGGAAVIALVLQLVASMTGRRPAQSTASLFAEGGPRAGGADGGMLGSVAIAALAGYLLGRHLFRR
ncbi:MAG: hypothetical protein WD036_00295 [Bauldia sp.]